MKFIRHPEYDYNGLKNDVAMVKLGEFLDMTSEYVRPISLPEEKQANWLDGLDGEMTKVCGWGKISLRPQVYPDELHCVDVPIGKFQDILSGTGTVQFLNSSDLTVQQYFFSSKFGL